MSKEDFDTSVTELSGSRLKTFNFIEKFYLQGWRKENC
jgi:hypothetical protein